MDIPTIVRTRFAPSPTGMVHIGSLRTALFSHLFAKHCGGVSVLRIEDTDQTRKVEGAVENLLSVMKTMGIEFDEGFYLADDGSVQERGEFGPYKQSLRLEIYQSHAKQLIEQGHAYYCFCTPERLDEVRKEQMALKKPPMYDGHCRTLSSDVIEKQLAEFSSAGKNPVVRQVIPDEGTTTINDLIYGDITYENKLIDDHVLLKSDGFPTYHLAVVVDDHYMQITHVIRGEEWIPSTPKHLLLYKAFGWTPTLYAHLPLILNPNKTKLSKRQGDVAVEDFLKHGYLKEALINFVAFLGWNPKTEQEIFSIEELIAQFDLNKVNKAGAVFDDAKLDWLNGQYIKGMDAEALMQLLKPYWIEAGITVGEFDDSYLIAVAKLEQERLKKLSEIGELTKYFFVRPDYDSALLMWRKSDAADAKQKLSMLHQHLSGLSDADFSLEVLEKNISAFIAENGFENGPVLWPLRVALTGKDRSPGPFEVAATLAHGLGKQEVLERLTLAIEKL